MSARSRLSPARDALLTVHRALLETERVAWQRLNGRVTGGNELLQLAIHDPWFAWLNPLTALIAAIDENIAEPGEGDQEAQAIDLLNGVHELMHPDEEGSDFQQRYFEFIQRSPDVAVAHGALMKELSRRSRGP